MKKSSTDESLSTEQSLLFRQKILDWYDVNRRILPWRALSGDIANPYHVWLSEVMLQQTTVAAAIPYFLKFISKWPRIQDLAQANNDEVMNNWAGLGYYARARNLYKCAKIISSEYGGHFPKDQAILKTLPGIGDYTSAAIVSIAFDKPSTVVDGNVERVMARYHACEDYLPKAKPVLKSLAHMYSNDFHHRPGDYAQALMDLGATVCTPKSPSCERCPVNASCRSYKTGNPEQYPRRASKQDKPRKHGYVYWVVHEQSGDILVEKRPDKGLLGGMYALPTSEWVDISQNPPHLQGFDYTLRNDFIDHVFTHFHLQLGLCIANIQVHHNLEQGYGWVSKNEFNKIGFPTVFKKAIRIFE